MTKDGKSPLYFRLTIDGLQEEMSTGIKVAVQGWNVKLKQVTDIERDYKLHNKRLRKIETDLGRLVDLVQATDQLATPAKVLAAYRTPVGADKAAPNDAGVAYPTDDPVLRVANTLNNFVTKRGHAKISSTTDV